MAAVAEKRLFSEPYYHGLLPREDIKMMLRRNGEFIVRTTEPTAGGARCYVLSVMHNQTLEEEGIKHYIIRHDPVFQKYLIETLAFNSVSDLVTYHVRTKTSIVRTNNVIIQYAVPRHDWELNHESIICIKKLGEGAFGEVQLGKLTRKRGDVVDVAIKLAKIEQLTKEQIKEIMGEARLMRLFDHPNVVRFYGVAAGQEPLMVVMELASDGALDSYLRKNSTLSVGRLNEMVMQAAWGIEHIHQKGVLHRDIAARNCLYGDGKVKIADFGLSRETTFYQMDPHKRVPIRWLAPETLKTAMYTQKTDVFSYGIMCWEIYNYGIEPYPGMTVAEVNVAVRDNGYRMGLPEYVPPAIAKLILTKCWTQSTNERATMPEIVRILQRTLMMVPPSLTTDARSIVARPQRSMSSAPTAKVTSSTSLVAKPPSVMSGPSMKSRRANSFFKNLTVGKKVNSQRSQSFATK